MPNDELFFLNKPQTASLRKQRLDKWLSNLGYCSRSQAPQWLRQHEVTLQVEGEKGRVARLLKGDQHVIADRVFVDGKPLEYPYGLSLLLYKPKGLVCSHSHREGPTIYDLLPQRWRDRTPSLESFGRLDKDTTGLLLISDDSLSMHELMHAKKGIRKRYLVELDGPIPEEAIASFASGSFCLKGESKPLLPATLTILSANSCWLELQEGRYHQVKRMFDAWGLKVVQLHRDRLGPFTLDEGAFKGLQPGEWAVLNGTL